MVSFNDFKAVITVLVLCFGAFITSLVLYMSSDSDFWFRVVCLGAVLTGLLLCVLLQ